MEPVKFALIGAGGIAQSYAQAFEGHAFARVAAVVDVRAETAQAMAERLVCPAYTSPTALAKGGPRIDAAIVCTPPDTHEEIALTLVELPAPVE
jgi:predicted dehydrogenase